MQCLEDLLFTGFFDRVFTIGTGGHAFVFFHQPDKIRMIRDTAAFCHFLYRERGIDQQMFCLVQTFLADVFIHCTVKGIAEELIQYVFGYIHNMTQRVNRQLVFKVMVDVGDAGIDRAHMLRIDHIFCHDV